jgi:SPX domain protein involved in polyphosphate accumulation
MVAPHLQHDPFSINALGNKYSVCSLYFDNQELFLYNQTKNSEKNRYKLRVRSYGDRENDDLFFEVKKRLDQVIRKDRARVGREEGIRIVDAIKSGRPVDLIKDNAELNSFLHLSRESSALPNLRVRYMREAFESRSADPVRITLDTDLMTCPSPNAELSSSEGSWVRVPDRGVILEVKYSGDPPPWVQNIMEVFNLTNQSVPKYILSVDSSPHLSRVASQQYGTA